MLVRDYFLMAAFFQVLQFPSIVQVQLNGKSKLPVDVNKCYCSSDCNKLACEPEQDEWKQRKINERKLTKFKNERWHTLCYAGERVRNERRGPT